MSKPEINVTPLIDVLLVLLIIFMVITPTKPNSFEAKIPQEPKDVKADPHPETLVVVVNPDTTIRLNGESTTATVEATDALISRLAQVFQAREANMSTERTVFIKAPRRLAYGSVAKVVDAVKASGAYPISLQIDDLD